MNRQIKNIVIHCTAGPPSQRTRDIQNYWRNSRGWTRPGYHIIINADGTTETLAPFSEITNGVKGHNANSIHICYKGGVVAGKSVDNRTPQQKATMERLVRELKLKFPSARILGHRDFPGVKKACPSFDVSSWLKEIGINP